MGRDQANYLILETTNFLAAVRELQHGRRLVQTGLLRVARERLDCASELQCRQCRQNTCFQDHDDISPDDLIWVETQLAPTLRKGDVVILDNLSSHKSQAAEQVIRAKGAWLLFLPPYSPDLNPIEMAFSKLKAHLRARAVRTIDDLWRAIGDICNLFDAAECSNFFKAAGCGDA